MVFVFNALVISEGRMIRLENPHRAQIYQFELVEQFEATVSQSTVPPPSNYYHYYQ